MATLDWAQCPAVESIPGKVSGAWVFKNTRLPVATIFENLEAGSPIEEIMEQFRVTREQINAVLEFTARSLQAPPVEPSMLTNRILFDHGTPSGIADALVGHEVAEAIDRGWDQISNGELLTLAEAAGFDLLLTTDKNFRYQQNLTNRKISIVVLGNSTAIKFPSVRI